MDHSHPHRVRTLVHIAAVLVGVALAPRLALLMLSVGVGLVVGTVLLGALAFWAVRRQARRLLTGAAGNLLHGPGRCRRDRRGPVMRGRAGLVGAVLAAAWASAAALGGERLGILFVAAVVVTWIGHYETVGLGS